MPPRAASTTALWIGRVMTGLFVLFMLFDVGIKLLRLPIVDEAMNELGYPPGLGFAIGVLEGALLILYLFPHASSALCYRRVRRSQPCGSAIRQPRLFGVYLAVRVGGLWFAIIAARLPLRAPLTKPQHADKNRARWLAGSSGRAAPTRLAGLATDPLKAISRVIGASRLAPTGGSFFASSKATTDLDLIDYH